MLGSRDVPLAPLTTLRLGGRATALVAVGDDEELVEAVSDADRRGEPVFVLGGGSNVVVADEGFAGVVVRMASRGVALERRGARVRLEVAAGEEWDALVARCVDEGFAGLEALSGIPGLVGATPIQNVGAYGHEVAETLVSVRVFDRGEGRFAELGNAACRLGYRTSVFRGDARFVVTRVTFELDAGGPGAPVRYAELARSLGVKEGARPPASEVRAAVLALRRSKGMVVDPGDPDSVSAGSFFVNPTISAAELEALSARAAAAGVLRPGEDVPRFPRGDRFKVPAAWLVERAGFHRGFGDGHVGVSRKHTLALVHRGGGTTEELLALARRIRQGVGDRLGVTLCLEPVLLGCAL